MACILYVKIDGQDIKVGEFKNRKVAMEHFHFFRSCYRQKDGTIGKPIWVETRRSKHGE